MPGVAAVRIVTRDVSPRLGQRIAAQCLELPLDASLEALTVIAPAARDGTLSTLAVNGSLAQGGVGWSDAAGRHRVTIGAGEEASQLPEGAALRADLLWCVEDSDHDSRPALVAAMPAFSPGVPKDAQVVTDLPEKSGKMMLWTNTNGFWAQLSVDEPRRG
jgi:hypothetical protein